MMKLVLGFLPYLTLIIFFCYLYGMFSQKVQIQPASDEIDKSNLTDALVYSIITWGSYIVIISEGFGVFRAISFFTLLFLWSVPLLILLVLGLKNGMIQAGWKAILKDLQASKLHRFEKILLGILIFWSLLLLMIALISPPNTNDSLSYHMPRVAHWAQNGSLAHYPTAYEFQLYNAIWAELLILQTYLLGTSDKLANLVQWFSMVASVYMSMVIARILGARRLGQLVAGVAVMTIPMGILQSTSTQNDYVAAFWLMVLLYLILRTKEKIIRAQNALFLGAAIGLGMLTKGTYYPYALPFLLWLFVPFLKRIGFRKTFLFSAVVAGIALLLNIPFWARNYSTYHSIIGPAWWVQEKSLGSISPQAIIVNTARQISVHFGTPFASINSQLSAGIVHLCELFKQVDCVVLNNSEQYTYRIPLISNHEDTAGNPIHLLLIGIVFCLVVFMHRKFGNKIVAYAMALGMAYLVFSATVLWELYGSRYQLPFFVLAGPLCGLVFTEIINIKLVKGLAVFLLVASLPWLIFNRTRPLIGLTPRITTVGSIFTTNRTDLLLANQDWIREPIITITNQYRSIDCKQVGLWIDSRDPEFLFWDMLNVQKRGLRLESLFYEPHLIRYANKDFTPCAIICSICGGKTELEGLPLVFRAHGLDLYLSSGQKKP